MSEPPAALRVAVAGCGRVVERCHLPALRRSRRLRLVAACDPLAERRTWMAAAAPGVATHASLDALLAAHPIDAVLIAAPVAHHAPLAVAALAAGAHVLVEKPMATDLDAARRILAAASDAGRQVHVCLNRRFYPGFAALRRHLAATSPLRSVLITSAESWSAVDRPTGDDPLEALDDLGPHHLDLLPWLAGAPVVAARVLAEAGGAGVRVRCELELASGATCVAVVGRGAAYEERVEAAAGGRPLCATAHTVSAGAGSLRHVAARAAWSVRRRLGRDFLVACAAAQLDAFAAAIAGGPRTSAATGEDGLAAVAVVAACRASAAQDGARVAVDGAGGGKA
jgi:predicted dehydrogenase